MQTRAAKLSVANHQPIGLQNYARIKAEKKQVNILRGKLLSEKYKASGSARKKPQTKSAKSGLIMPVHRMLKEIKKKCPHFRVQLKSAVLLAGVVEYLIAEVLDLSGSVATELKKKRITPRHVYLAVENDTELDQLLKDVHIAEGGVVPNIHPTLLKNKKENARAIKRSLKDADDEATAHAGIEHSPKSKKHMREE